MRTIAAFLIAPVSPGLVVLLVSQGVGTSGGGWAFVFSASVAYPLAVILGIPAYFAMQKYNHKGLISYFIFGALFSIVPIVYFIVFPKLSSPEGLTIFWSNIALAVIFFLASVSATCVFWLIARPDLKPNKQV